MTVACNQFQNHNQLLRHGMLNWVTRGVFLGYQRNYLELQVDDLFLGDDAWDPETNTTSYDPADASRMTPGRRRPRDRLAPGPRPAAGHGLQRRRQRASTAPGDPLAAKFAEPAVNSAFGYINHTLEHPNLDCSTSPFITRQITDNLAWARDRGSRVTSAAEVVTGEHSGLANARPGNPGTIDPPSFDDVDVERRRRRVPAGTYEYALTARSPAGETVASTVENVGRERAASRVSFDAVCHAVGYDLYRRPAGGAWARVATLARAAPTRRPTTAPTRSSSRSPTPARPATPRTPPAANGAALAPYGQNPAFLAGLKAAGIRYVATDASKGYPRPRPSSASTPLPPGGVLRQRRPRRAALPEQRLLQRLAPGPAARRVQLDLRRAARRRRACRSPASRPAARRPRPGPSTSTSETRVMFRHVVTTTRGRTSSTRATSPTTTRRCPRPTRTRAASCTRSSTRWWTATRRPSTAPSAPLRAAHPHADRARRSRSRTAWAAERASVTAWLQDGRVYVRNAGARAVDVPLTGHDAGGSTAASGPAGSRSRAGAGAGPADRPIRPPRAHAGADRAGHDRHARAGHRRRREQRPTREQQARGRAATRAEADQASR